MTAFLDWISQQLATAPLWIQSPIVILGAVLVCILLAAPLLRMIDILAAWTRRTAGGQQHRSPHSQRGGQGRRSAGRNVGGTRIISESQPS